MAGLDKETPILTSHHIKERRVFVWNGSTKVFLAMAKYLEDKINLEADTKLGDVRVILVVEDSVKYYSRYLPLLYTEIMSQTQAMQQHYRCYLRRPLRSQRRERRGCRSQSHKIRAAT